jgi:putative ABC transport system permease protein
LEFVDKDHSRLSVEKQAEGTRNGRKTIVWLQTIAFLFGLSLLIFILQRVGLAPIFQALLRIGFGFFLLLGISGLRHIFRSVAMTAAIPGKHRNFSFFQALQARIGGEAISFLTFTGPLLGEATKAALLKNRLPLTYGVPALVLDNLIYNLSVALFILSGACVMLLSYDLPDLIQYVLLAIAGTTLLILLLSAFAINRRVMPLTAILNSLARMGLKKKLLISRRKQVRRFETDLYNFYHGRRRAFFVMVSFNFLAHATSVFEVYCTLRLLGYSVLIRESYSIESLTKIINFAFGFIPATIGVYELGNEIILTTLGFASATGVTLAIVRKAGAVFWTSIGLTIILRRAVPDAIRRLADRYPRLQKFMDNLVFSNLAHRPARTFTSIMGVAVGVVLIVLTVGLSNGILLERGRREANIGAEIMLRASGTLGLSGSQPFALPLSRVDEISRMEGVKLAVPIGQNTVSSDSGFGMRIVDAIPFDEYSRISGLKIIEGRKLEGGDEAIVDSVWRTQRGAGIGSTIQIYDRPFRIVGIYEPPGGGRVKIPLKTMQDQLGGEGHCSSVLVSSLDPKQQDLIAERIHQRFPEDQIIFTRDLPELYASGVPALNVFIKVIVMIAAAISILVILLAMYTSVMERTKQIGILKSLGMSNLLIAWIIEQEAIVVSVIGVIVGLAATYAARYAIMSLTSLNVEIQPYWVAVSLGIGLLGGTLGAIYPALRAARQDPVEALSYE